MKILENLLIKTISKYTAVNNQIENAVGTHKNKLILQRTKIAASIKRINDEIDSHEK